MTSEEKSGPHRISDEQRARVQRAVDNACEEIDLLTRATIAVALHEHRRRVRVARILAALACVGGAALVALGLWALGRLAVVIGGAP
jgi:hypothetical protein